MSNLSEVSDSEVFEDGWRSLAIRMARDLDDISDDDGSLSGGDCVEYIYELLTKLGVVEMCENGHCHPLGECRFCDDDVVEFRVLTNGIGIWLDDDQIVGPRDQLLLLARTIHDTLEGADQ